MLDNRYALDFGKYDVAADGERFLVLQNENEVIGERGTEIVVVLNWSEELRRLAPAR